MSSRSTILACILATTAVVNGFSPSQHILPPRTPISKLQAATTTINESQYPNLLSQASLCADDESCSIEAANLYLKEIVHYQSGCAAGTLSGNEVCEDVVGVSEVVANLRHKIDNSNGVDNKVEKNDKLVESIAFATLYALATGIALSRPHLDGNVVPFTIQEVWWAIKDGYATDLATHYFHNGGLLVGDALSSSVRGMTPEELLWSARDGYMFSSYGLDGGVESLPLTPQEVWWSIKDGYVTDLAGHYFRNGGL